MATFIRTGQVGIVETFGKYSKIIRPGLNFYFPFLQKVHKMNTQIDQMDLEFGVRTKCNAFSRINLAVQYQINSNVSEKSVYSAFYSLRNPRHQTISYIENIIRSKTSKMTLNELFQDNEELCGEVKRNLSTMLDTYGYQLVDTLITNIEPELQIKTAMNKVRASESLKEAANNEAEATRVRIVKEAEAEKEKKRLQGEGIAEQRSAILNGYKHSIKNLTGNLGVGNQTAIQLALFSQYCDTLKDISTRSNTKTIFIPSGQNDILASFRQTLMEVNEGNNNNSTSIPPIQEEEDKEEEGSSQVFYSSSDKK